MYKLMFLFVGFLLFGCGRKELKRTWSYEMLGEVFYQVKWFSYPTLDDKLESVQYYISETGDTIINQVVVFWDEETIDTLSSEFYSLQIYPTDTLDTYKGVLVLYNRFNKLQVGAENKRRLQLLYDEITDSLILSAVSSDTSNRLEFYYRNSIDHHLTGVLLQDVFRDTLVGNDTLLNYGKTRLLIDTRELTNNTFIESHRFLKVKGKNSTSGYFFE
ncbi:hypothetical protein [Myroides fluvii]|uniref:hypothetical protein n=1 Tax=Myroides fluvii TaxID=2572594 RepID=UPI0018EF2A41|nr:hypothetical protein [Myroides fluvii]